MSTRPKPSERPELHAVGSTEAGEILEAPAALSPAEQLVTEWQSRLYSGSRALELPPRRWALRNWLPLDAVAAIYGPPKSGKSMWALAMVLEWARGGRWAGEQLEPAKVLYVAAERGTTQRDRLEAWKQHYGLEIPAGFTLFAPRRPPQLTSEVHGANASREVDALCLLIEQVGARVVVLDTLARMTLGIEENSARDMGPVFENLDRIREATRGGTVLVIHHTGKDASKGLRGSSALLGALDLTIAVSQETEGLVQARVKDSNEGAHPLPHYSRITPITLPALAGDDMQRTLPVIVPTDRPDDGLEVPLLELVELLEPVSSTRLKEALEADYGVVPSPATLGRTLKNLVKAGRLEKIGSSSSTRYKLPAGTQEHHELF